MIFGIGLIFLLQWAFLGNLRSAIIVGMTIPFALFFAVGILVIRGESANLLSVGAIDFGLIVDATVIMVESIFRWLSGQGNREATEEAIRTLPPAGLHGKRLAIFHAAADVNRSIFFAAGIIIAPTDLTELIPVATAKDSDLWVTQIEGSVIEEAGVLKMDFLGLKTLSILFCQAPPHRMLF